jgi:hypothetical protein
MSDPRNAAHDKKVQSDKKHQAPEAEVNAPEAGATPAPASDAGATPSGNLPESLPGSITVLSQLKEMDFHSRANLERLAELTLTVGDTLKQKEFAKSIGEIFSAQDAFQTRLAALITPYQAECERLQKVSNPA